MKENSVCIFEESDHIRTVNSLSNDTIIGIEFYDQLKPVLRQKSFVFQLTSTKACKSQSCPSNC